MFQFDNTYSKLPEAFHAKAIPTVAKEPQLIAFNQDLARELGLNFAKTTQEELCHFFSGKVLPPGSAAVAMAYAGHQFAHFVPQLGDGRALLLGEVLDPQGNRFDIQLKGSGPTPFSRRGDGRSSLGPVIREYLVSEAMYALGVPTTRALAATRTGETVYRDEALPGGVFTRVASSHLRIGTFEYFACRNDFENLKRLADYAIFRHYEKCFESSSRYLCLFENILERQSRLVSKWLGLGFIHGVMNTDNTSISGETIDYGPCAFMDTFKHDQVYSFIDKNGRYAYFKQGEILQWNLSILAGCLLQLDPRLEPKFRALLDSIPGRIEDESIQIFGRKLGISHPRKEDKQLIEEWLFFLEEESLDYTLSFYELKGLYQSGSSPLFPKSKRFEKFKIWWLSRLEEESQVEETLKKSNPVIIPRNHLVERAIQEALNGDYSFFHRMHEALKSPYDCELKESEFFSPPLPEEIVSQTFCGT